MPSDHPNSKKLRYPSLNSHENGVLRGYFFKNSKNVYKHSSHLIALGKIKPHPRFQNLLPKSEKKKPLSRRVNHALIAA